MANSGYRVSQSGLEWLGVARSVPEWSGNGPSAARSPPKRALTPEGGVMPEGGTSKSAWHAKSRRPRTQMARMMCVAVAWVFARMLDVRVWLVRVY